MSDTNLSAKLKARLNEWQGYMEQSHASRQQAPNGEETPVPREETNVVSAESLPATDVSDSLIEGYESRIADLRDALEQERAHAYRLAEELAREKTLNAVSHAHQTSASPRRAYRPLRAYPFATQEAGAAILWLLITVLAICGLCSLIAFAFLH